MDCNTFFINLFITIKFFKVVLINVIRIWMMWAKLATPGLLTIKVFWDKSYDVMISVHTSQKIISRDSNCIVDVVMWLSFVTPWFLWEPLSQLQFCRGLIRKTDVFEKFKFSNLGLVLGMTSKFYSNVAHEKKKVLTANHSFWRSSW